MKKAIKMFSLFLCIILLSGCMKSRISMDIGKDKSMNFTYEILISDKLNEGDNGSLTDNKEQLDALEKKGFTINPKTENGYSGYIISKKYSNLDDISKNSSETVNLSDLLDGDFDDSKMFKVEEGFLKNTYTAKFKVENAAQNNQNDFSGGDMSLVDDGGVVTTENAEGTSETTTNDNETVTNDNELTASENEIVTTEQSDSVDSTDGNSENIFGDQSELLSLTSEMESTYTVKLPYGADSNNATSVSEDGKTLTWNLMTDTNKDIEYTFSIYNIKNIAIIAGGALVLIIIIIVLISKKGKKKTASSETLIHTDYDSSIVGQINETSNEVNQIPQGNTNHEIQATNQEQVNNQVPAQDTIVGNEPPVASSLDEAPVDVNPAPVQNAPSPAPIVPEQANVVPTTPEVGVPQMTSPEVQMPTMAPVDNQMPTMAPVDNQTPTMSNGFANNTEVINQMPQMNQSIPYAAPSENVSSTPVVNQPNVTGGLDIPNMVAFSDMNDTNQMQ